MDLKQSIWQALSTFKHSSTKPPFTIAELAVMALAMKRKPPTETDVITWICARSKYYRQAAAASLSVAVGPWHEIGADLEARINSFRVDFRELSKTYGVPIYRQATTGNPNYHVRFYTVKSEAMIFLQRCLEEHPGVAVDQEVQQPFRFFELPPELRNTIYGMVFGIPGGAVAITCGEETQSSKFRGMLQKRGTVYVKLDQSRDTLALEDWSRVSGTSKIQEVGKVKDLLSPTMVNRQWYEESMSFFYKNNTFFCYDLLQLHNLLTKLPPARRCFVTQLAFGWTGKRQGVHESFELMAKLPKLRTLHIDTCDVVRPSHPTAQNHQGTITRPGQKSFMKVRVSKNVVFYGARQATIDVLKQSLLRPKAEPKAAKKKMTAKSKALGGVQKTKR